MLTFALLAGVALVVGFFVGAVGVGTVLMVPTFALAAGLPIHSAAGTALFTGSGELLGLARAVWIEPRG